MPASTTTATSPWLAWRGVRAFWRELPRGLAAGTIVLAAAVPLVAALLFAAPGWMRVIATVPPALALTGLARFAAAAARGDGPRLGLLRAADPVLALLLAACASLAWLALAAGGASTVAGAAGAAASLLVFPYALVYGALRDRRGVHALRGGVILVAFRPSQALTVVALYWLGGFAVAASTGVLAPVVVPLLLTVTASMTIGLLDDIDTLQGRA